MREQVKCYNSSCECFGPLLATNNVEEDCKKESKMLIQKCACNTDSKYNIFQSL